jgi:hypothetical protein
MKGIRKIFHITLTVLMIFLAITSIPGGITLATGVGGMTIPGMEDTIFGGQLIPGLALFLIVGGSSALASYLLLKKSKYALPFSILAALIIMFFEFVEVMVIGSPPGVALTLQIVYFGLGTLIVLLALGAWLIDLRSMPE